MSLQFARPVWLQLLVFAVVTGLLWRFNQKSEGRWKVILSIAWACYILSLISPMADFLITVMGVGGELTAALLIGWLAFNRMRTTINYQGVLYGFLSLVLWVNVIRFAVTLMFNEQQRLIYEAGRPDGITNDLIKLSQWSGISLSVYCLLILLITAGLMYYCYRLADKPFLIVQQLW